MMNTPEERISYSVICDKQPDPHIYHLTYEEAVRWAKLNQPAYRPYYIINDCLDEIGWFPMLLMGISIVIFSYSAYEIHYCKYSIPEKIAMYEEENAKIEEKVSNTVNKYMEYEKNIVIEVGPDDDAFSLVSLYPELGADTLVSNEIEVYTSNNKKIKELKDQALNISNYRFWMYFGK